MPGIALTLMPSYEMKLSPRQLEILRLVAQGDTVKAVALSLGISVHTVKAHLKIAKERLHARTATHAAALAIQKGIISLGPSTGSRKDDSPNDRLSAAV